MRPYTTKTSGRFQGRPAGQDTSAFESVLHSVYDKARGLSNGGRWVTNPRTGQRVGLLRREDGLLVFSRQVIVHKHRLDMFGGAWALERDLIAHLEQLGVQWVCLKTDTARRLYAPLTAFRDSPKTISYPGFGVQAVLPESAFHDCIVDAAAAVTPLPKPSIPVQPSLFEGGAYVGNKA